MTTIDEIRAEEIRRVEEIRRARNDTKYNHRFRTSHGTPPSNDDKPGCGADLPAGCDFACTNRQPYPDCEEARQRGLPLAEQLRRVSS